ERGRTKSNLKKLERVSGLHVPKTVPTRVGCLASLCCSVAILAGVFSLQPGFPLALLGTLLGLMAAAAIIKCIDPGRLPANCATLADIARIAAATNYGRLVKMGARHSDEDIWENLVEPLSHYALPRFEITRETYFLESQLKKNAV